ncbi:MAG: dTDP-4-dehydrorhamnose reductase [Planctomycetaceae bacterium]|nr:dTDP-4-dehydrorhamnose reductase [Planctomycetaceae bacterium]
MRVLIAGGQGQLGSDLGPAISAAGLEPLPLGRTDIELTRPETIEAALDQYQPVQVINCAAWNLVDLAEDTPEDAFAVNSLGARNLAIACHARSIPLVHISTDFVFSGMEEGGDRKSPYTERDLPGPLSVYGCSKLAGEYLVTASCPDSMIVRTCGLYGLKATRAKGNFVETMLRLGAEREELSVVHDQRCTPTFTRDLAEGIVRLCQSGSPGVYHLTSSGDASWFEFAREIMQIAGLKCRVRPIPATEFASKAPRPCYSVLSTEKFTAATGMLMPEWPDALRRYLAERLSDENSGS